jgi:hypothetical protein
MRRFVLFNPLSSSGKGEALARKLDGILLGCEIIYLDITDLKDFKTFFAQISEDDEVYVCGGDGTLNSFVNLTADIPYKNKIYYFATGSGNDFLRDLGKDNGLSPFCINKYLQNLPIVTVDGKDYTGGAEISLLIGYGYQSVEVLLNGNKVNFSYGMYDGRVVFNVTANGVYTIAKSNKIDIKGVVVNGVSLQSDNTFASLDEAIDYVVAQPFSDVEENITYFIFSEVKYLVEEGEIISFTGDNAKIKSVSVIGATEDATLIIDGMSGSLPSLPAAEKGVKISYSDLLMNSEKQDDYRCFDYRGNADITFKNCTFKRALAARGPQSNVVVDGCTFACETVEDTHKGYCYYSIPIIGSDVIRVEFINNQVTKSWGGINIDWGDAEFYIAGNTFSNINCSKPAIQLSRARSVVIEKNKFTDIKDENAFRFYSGYAAGSTHILDNEIDVDYLFHSDYVDAINNYKDFVFKGNVISSRTNLTTGHITNSTPDQIREHGYVVDETLNTIE